MRSNLSIQRIKIIFKNPVSHNSLCKIVASGVKKIYSIVEDKNNYFAIALVDSKETEKKKHYFRCFVAGEKIDPEVLLSMKFFQAFGSIIFFRKIEKEG